MLAAVPKDHPAPGWTMVAASRWDEQPGVPAASMALRVDALMASSNGRTSGWSRSRA